MNNPGRGGPEIPGKCRPELRSIHFCFLACITACDGVDAPQGGPALSPVVAIVLQEPDTLPVARPVTLGFDDSGRVYLTEAFHERVIAYSRDGKPLRAYGRKGRGPGEFEMIGLVLVVGDSTLLVSDGAKRAVQLFRVADGSYEGQVGYVGTTYTAYWDSITNIVWMGLLSPTQRTGLGRFHIGDTTTIALGPLPTALRSSGPLSGMHTLVGVAPAPEGRVVVAFSAVDSLYLVGPDGSVLKAVELPSIRRRSRKDLSKFFATPRPFPDLFEAASFLMGVYRLSNGDYVLLHFDQDVIGRNITSAPYVSVVRADLATACLDGQLQVPSLSRHVATVHGDTIFFLVQSESPGTIQTALIGYTLSLDGCEWTPLRQ